MAYFPERIFGGIEGRHSIDEQGPEAIKRDFDEINAMFNPKAVHDNGVSGGISAENMSESFWAGRIIEGKDTTLSEILESAPIEGLSDPDDSNIPAITIWSQIKGVWKSFKEHVMRLARVTATDVQGIHGIRVDESTGIIQYKNSLDDWTNANATMPPGYSPPLIDSLNQVISGVGALDARQGNTLRERIKVVEQAVHRLEEAVHRLEESEKFFSVILQPELWVSGQYTISNPYIKADTSSAICLVEISPTTWATDAEQMAFAKANLELARTSDQTNGQLIITASGVIPSITIPCVCFVSQLEV